MPYIKEENREGAASWPIDVGELNYAITMTLINYVIDKGLCYQTINDIIGALECAKAEFQNRVVVPYELKKQIENGDVYDELNKVWDELEG